MRFDNGAFFTANPNLVSRAQLVAYPGAITFQWFNVSDHAGIVSDRLALGKDTGIYGNFFRFSTGDSSINNVWFDANGFVVNSSTPGAFQMTAAASFVGTYDATYGTYRIADPNDERWKRVTKFVIRRAIGYGMRVMYVDDISAWGFGRPTVNVIERQMVHCEFAIAFARSLARDFAFIGNFDWATLAYMWHTSNLTDSDFLSDIDLNAQATLRTIPRGTWYNTFADFCREAHFYIDNGTAAETIRAGLEESSHQAARRAMGASNTGVPLLTAIEFPPLLTNANSVIAYYNARTSTYNGLFLNSQGSNAFDFDASLNAISLAA